MTLTLIGGQNEGRKVFDSLPDLRDNNVSPGWKKMAKGRLIRILETVGMFNPANPESYKAFASATFEEVARAIDGKRVAVRISVEKSDDPAYADKNKVGEYLSPNPTSAGYKDFIVLQGGSAAISQARSAAFDAPKQTSAAPNWIKTPGKDIKPPFDDNMPF